MNIVYTGPLKSSDFILVAFETRTWKCCGFEYLHRDFYTLSPVSYNS